MLSLISIKKNDSARDKKCNKKKTDNNNQQYS